MTDKNLIYSTNSWVGEEKQTTQEQVYTFSTSNKYMDKNISFKVNVNEINLENNQDFVINDGINSWTFSKDASGNVTIY